MRVHVSGITKEISVADNQLYIVYNIYSQYTTLLMISKMYNETMCMVFVSNY